ncbi:hypothetical protein EDB85DRAFT_169699 [Lactarius pseudohatsudake]|nr:hypothetical protein EDB85DRAFT_169699 [Lactarius pseudohatsudake]
MGRASRFPPTPPRVRVLARLTPFAKCLLLKRSSKSMKPNPAPPKSKYIDPIIAAIHDVCKARFREPNSTVMFKALIVLHTMVWNGATDNVLQYLSSSDVLRLKNVSCGQWEGMHYTFLPIHFRTYSLRSGYNPPKNLQHYALYLDTRIRSYRDIKHDDIRVQSETKIPQLCKFVDRSEK